MQATDQVLEVWGELACFTRPEMRVERFSYPIITPSAARGILDAIYSKPNKDPTQAQFRWQVTSVEVLPYDGNPGEALAYPAYIALRRNEVKEKASTASAVVWMQGRAKPEPILADADASEKGRTQRQTMALREVRYRLHAEIRPWPRFAEHLPALEAQFRRRAARGQCVYQPYFGCREFPAYFELVEPGRPAVAPIPWDAELGLMLYDVFDQSRPDTSTSEARISLFRAAVHGGVMRVPPYESDEVLKVEGGAA